MKTRHLVLVIISLFIGSNVQAQFLKKLKKKVQEVTENVVIQKTADNVAEKAGDGVDGIFDAAFGKMNGKNSEALGGFAGMEIVDSKILPDIYDFNWKYVMNMEIPNGKAMELIYYLKEDAKYFGMSPNLKSSKKDDMFMVMDTKLEVNAMFTNSGNKKVGMVMGLPDFNDMDDEDEDLISNYDFVELPAKVINGVECQGFKMENSSTEMVVYADMNSPVSLSSVYGINTKSLPKGFNPKWLDKVKNSLVMELTYTDKKNNRSTKMNCVAIEKERKIIDVQSYTFNDFNKESLADKD
ncbi:hypothetical protein [Formosa haliotis]|uniref:hypothetical protein n=1 Tax=Formosa haliotis TaxID=1555194 RepID=UPI00082427BD|nr:hypothetical protein [Formosa haliotis]